MLEAKARKKPVGEGRFQQKTKSMPNERSVREISDDEDDDDDNSVVHWYGKCVLLLLVHGVCCSVVENIVTDARC